jgi:hypothetical protein
MKSAAIATALLLLQQSVEGTSTVSQPLQILFLYVYIKKIKSLRCTINDILIFVSSVVYFAYRMPPRPASWAPRLVAPPP